METSWGILLVLFTLSEMRWRFVDRWQARCWACAKQQLLKLIMRPNISPWADVREHRHCEWVCDHLHSSLSVCVDSPDCAYRTAILLSVRLILAHMSINFVQNVGFWINRLPIIRWKLLWPPTPRWSNLHRLEDGVAKESHCVAIGFDEIANHVGSWVKFHIRATAPMGHADENNDSRRYCKKAAERTSTWMVARDHRGTVQLMRRFDDNSRWLLNDVWLYLRVIGSRTSFSSK